MINADEHKKLLEEIAELEKNSVNYFDVEKEFFLIDSDNLPQVHPQPKNFMSRQDIRDLDIYSHNQPQIRSKLYGYSIQRDGIYEDDNLTAEAVAGLDGRGCYVYVEVKDGQITIKQDLNGSWGIYLFRHGDYFALSNSFFRLVDHVKFKYPLTVNRDYCYGLIIDDVAGYSYPETAVNEIQLVERNAIIQIDTTNRHLEIELINYKEWTVPLDSPEAMTILDNWVDFWSNVLRGLAQRTPFIQTDLSGGFDSRMTWVHLLHSGIDLNSIRVQSYKGFVLTAEEDYKIASQIAEHYGFKLNQSLPYVQSLNLSFSDAFNIDLYHRQTFHKWPAITFSKRLEKLYYFNGNAGEAIRDYWSQSPKEFIEIMCRKSNPYSKSLADKLSHSIKNVIELTFDNIRSKYNIENNDLNRIVQYLYVNTRCRIHFGKMTPIRYFQGTVSLSPALDPEIRTLCMNSPKCPDFNLLMALIFTRYEPDLLTFPFDSGHFIAPETIEYARKISESFPRKHVAEATGGGQFNLLPLDTYTNKILATNPKNKYLSSEMVYSCIKDAFYSSRTRGLFSTYFEDEIYNYAISYYENASYGKVTHAYSILGITRVLEDVEISQRNHLPYRDMQRFLEQDFTTMHKGGINIPMNFLRYLTARIDIKLLTTTGDFQIQSVSDEEASILKPRWMQENCIGYQIQSYVGQFNFIAKTTVDGKIRLSLLGVDARTPEDKSKRIPYWIDYTKLIVNDKTIFDTLTPAWHNKPYYYTTEVKAGEELTVQVEWLPHRSDTLG